MLFKIPNFKNIISGIAAWFSIGAIIGIITNFIILTT
jgi:hypothetical protein